MEVEAELRAVGADVLDFRLLLLEKEKRRGKHIRYVATA